MRLPFCVTLLVLLAAAAAQAQTNPLWSERKVRNFLPHMTTEEVRELLTRSDIVIIPVPSLEQHGPHAPIGTDFYSGLEEAKLIAQKTDVLVAPILFVGQAEYHMGFPGSIALGAETIQRVYFEAAQSLMKHGFRRFLFLNSHQGNRHITRFIVDRVNQETSAVAIDLDEAATPLMGPPPGTSAAGAANVAHAAEPPPFDRHGGVRETSAGLYLFPSLIQLDRARRATLTFPPHLTKMFPDVKRGDPTVTVMFLTETLKGKDTGKGTSSAEMSTTGVWSERDPKDATAEQGRRGVERFVDAAVKFIERWKALRPMASTNGQ